MLVDSHCHLDFPEFAADMDGTVERARAAGVEAMVTICTRPSRLPEVLAIAERYPQVWCAVGTHPQQVAEEGVLSVDEIVALAQHPKIIGIGETGLDYFYDRSPRDQQRQSFLNHIEAAKLLDLPFIVHARDADADTADIITETCAAGSIRGLLHCFSSGPQLAEVAIKHGLYMSLAGIVTFKTAEALRTIVSATPLDRLLVETDSPFLAPVPMRGKRNEPAFVVHTAATIAKLKGVGIDAFGQATTDNFYRLFDKAKPPERAAA